MKKDYEILRELAKKYAEIAAMPFNDEYKRLWCKLNGLKGERPMYLMEELPWHELNNEGELTLQCEDVVCRMIEDDLRKKLYRFRYLHDDYVYEPYFYMPISMEGCGWDKYFYQCGIDIGINIEEETKTTDPSNTVVGHGYHDQFKTEEDLEKIRTPEVYVNKEETRLRESIANETIGDILGIRMEGFAPVYGVWDLMVMIRSMGSILDDMVERPDFVHKMVQRMFDAYMGILDQLNEKSLLAWPHRMTHEVYCGFSDELATKPNDAGGFQSKDGWSIGMAQLLYMVSPKDHNEFEFEYAKKWFSKFAMGYYGCCEPLEDRLEYVKQIPNVRKIGASAWVKDYDRFSEQLEKRYVMSIKPSPAGLVDGMWNPERLEDQISSLKKSADRYGAPCEFVLKDVSTVNYNRSKLKEWSEILRRVVES